MPGAPSFIALDWGTSSLRAWRFGESPNPQENVNSLGIMKLPSRQQHVRTLSTIRFTCLQRLAGTNPMPGTGLRHARQCARVATSSLFTLPGHSRGSGEAVDACYPPAADNAAHHSWRD